MVALVLVAISLGTRLAEAQEEGAIVKKGGSCFISGLPGIPTDGRDDSQAVLTPSGNSKITCHWPQFDEPLWPSETVVLTGFPCGSVFGDATDSRFVYTKNGRLTSTCFFDTGG